MNKQSVRKKVEKKIGRKHKKKRENIYKQGLPALPDANASVYCTSRQLVGRIALETATAPSYIYKLVET